MAAGCLALALCGVVLFQTFQAPAVRGDRPLDETVGAPAERFVAGASADAVATGEATGEATDGAADRVTDRVAIGATTGATTGTTEAAADSDLVDLVADSGASQPAAAADRDDARASAVVKIDPLALTALANAHDVRDTLARTIAARQEIECLALNIYFEARGEPDLGKLAVGHVVMNRVADQRFPDSVCNVIRQGGEWPRHRCQFSWWCDGKSDQPRDAVAWKRSKALARQVYWGGSADPTRGALWYHADYVAPAWGQVLERAVKIGRHIFYQERRAPGVQLASAYEPSTNK